MSSCWPGAYEELIQQKIKEIYPHLKANVQEDFGKSRLKVHVVVPGRFDEEIFIEELGRDYLSTFIIDDSTGKIKEEGKAYLIKLLQSFNSQLRTALQKIK